MAPIPLDTLNQCSPAEFRAALGDIFEHAPWVAERAAEGRPYSSLSALHQAMCAAVRTAGSERQLGLIKAHPDLAGRAVRAGTLTTASAAEQASAGLDGLTEEEYAEFRRLNAAYRDKFGFPFILCIRRHTKGSLLRQFERRLAADAAAERDTALAKIFRTAALRLDQRIEAPDRLPVHGHLSTHVLDVHGGKPAAGVEVELIELGGPAERVVQRGITNRDGRTDALIGGRPIPIGTYELRFAVGTYFASLGVPVADPAFLDVVLVRFSVAEPEGRYHVPLLVTPWSYTTYRGS
jgi:2-oxo-4-hydroxy-4-carboxy-5-ureidoimidazoline decarboxylase